MMGWPFLMSDISQRTDGVLVSFPLTSANPPTPVQANSPMVRSLCLLVVLLLWAPFGRDPSIGPEHECAWMW